MDQAAAHSLVVLHGYEDVPGRRTLVDPGDPGWRVLEPRGPIELPGGPAWFASDDDGPVEVQLLASVRQVQAVVASASASDPPGAVFLGGFSQGGAVALAAALSWPGEKDAVTTDATPPDRPAGVFCVNGWLPQAEGLAYDPAGLVAATTPVLVVASLEDEVVAVQSGRSAARWLERAGVAVTYVELPGGHGVGPDALAAVAAWIQPST